MNTKAKFVIQLCLTQLIMIILFALLLWGLKSGLEAKSVLLGGSIGLVANLFVAIKVFTKGVMPSETFMRLYYSGSMTKLVFIAAMIALTLTYIIVEPLWLIIGLSVSQIIYLIIWPFLKR